MSTVENCGLVMDGKSLIMSENSLPVVQVFRPGAGAASCQTGMFSYVLASMMWLV